MAHPPRHPRRGRGDRPHLHPHPLPRPPRPPLLARALPPPLPQLHDTAAIHADAELLTVRVETFATELTPAGTILDEEPFGFANAPGPLTAGYATASWPSPSRSASSNGAGAAISLVGGLVMVTAGSALVAATSGPMTLSAGASMTMLGGGDINAKAPNIKLNQ